MNRSTGGVKRIICAGLSLTLAAAGLPVPPAAAQVRLEGSTPQLLRAEEVLVTATECTALKTSIDTLGNPEYRAQRRKALDYWQRLVEAARADDRRIMDALWRDATDLAKDMLPEAKEAVLDGLNSGPALRARIRLLHSQGVLPASQEMLLSAKLQKWGDHLRTALDALETAQRIQQQSLPRFRQSLNEAGRSAQSAWEEFEAFGKALEDSGLGKDMGELLSAPLGSRAEMLFKFWYVYATSGLEFGYDFFKSNLPRYERELQAALTDYTRIDLDREMKQRRYDRYCPPKPPVKQARADTDPPPPPTAGQPSDGGAGAGAALVVLGVVAAGAAALAVGAAASGGGGGGDSGGSSSIFRCNSGDLACRNSSSGAVACCPRISGGFVGLCPSGNSCQSFAPFTSNTCPDGSRVANCCAGNVQCW